MPVVMSDGQRWWYRQRKALERERERGCDCAGCETCHGHQRGCECDIRRVELGPPPPPATRPPYVSVNDWTTYGF
jgi:hypothetical protein